MSKKKIENGVPIPDFKMPKDKPPKASKDLFVGGPLDGQIRKVDSQTGFFTTPIPQGQSFLDKCHPENEPKFVAYTYRRICPVIKENQQESEWILWLGEDVSITQLWDKLTNAYHAQLVAANVPELGKALDAALDAAKDMTIVSVPPPVVPTDFSQLANSVLSEHEWRVLQNAALKARRLMKPKPMIPIPAIRSRHILPAKPPAGQQSSEPAGAAGVP